MSDDVTPLGGDRNLPSSSVIPQAPPHPAAVQWFLHSEGQNYGPFGISDLIEFARDGRLQPTTDVVRVGSTNWSPASADPGLNSVFGNIQGKRVAPEMVQRRAVINSSDVSAAAGATVVQVTNNITPPRSTILIEDGIAKPKSAGVAILFSIFIVGSGQMYNGQIAKGILMMVGCILLWFIFLGWIINIWSMIDAYITATNMNDRYQRRLAAGLIV